MDWRLMVALGSLTVAFLGWLRNEMELAKFRTNCLATLQAEMREMMKDVERHRAEINDIYTQLAEIRADVAFLKGRLNGAK